MNRGDYIREIRARTLKAYLTNNENLGWRNGTSVWNFTFKAIRNRKVRHNVTEWMLATLETMRQKQEIVAHSDSWDPCYYPNSEKLRASMRSHVGDLLGEDARTVIDSLLLEMPRFVTPKAFTNAYGRPLRRPVDVPPPDRFNMELTYRNVPGTGMPMGQEPREATGITVTARQPRPQGGGRSYRGYKKVTIPINPPMPYNYRQEWLPGDVRLKEWYEQDWGKKIMKRYASEIQAAKAQLTQQFQTNQAKLKTARSMEVMVPEPETIHVGSQSGYDMMKSLAFNRKFRWASGDHVSLMALAQQKKPDDTLIRLVYQKPYNAESGKYRGKTYVLLNPEERKEFNRLMQMRARRRVDRAMGEAVLMEMPRYRFKRKEDTENDRGHPHAEYNLEADKWNRVFKCKVTAWLTSGDHESFVITEPFADGDQEKMANMSSAQIEKEFAPQLKRVHQKAIAVARAWVAKTNGPPVVMDEPESVHIEGSALPLIHDFRYVSLSHSGFGFGDPDEVAQFGAMRKPDDKLVKVHSTKPEGQDTRINKIFYVLLGPEEYPEFKRRVILADRERVGGEFSSE